MAEQQKKGVSAGVAAAIIAVVIIVVGLIVWGATSSKKGQKTTPPHLQPGELKQKMLHPDNAGAPSAPGQGQSMNRMKEMMKQQGRTGPQ